MAELTISQQLAAFAVETRSSAPPDEVVDSVRMRVMDVLGICVAARALPTSVAAVDYATQLGGAPQAHAVGVRDKMSAENAAFVNGVLAHSLDYDDTHLPSVLHPSASVVPAALATAEAVGAPAHRLVSAIAVGLEITVRLGMAGYDEEFGNSIFFEHGQHATAICGTMGSAAASAMLLGLDADGIAHAQGLAGSMASGILEANRTGGTVKRLHCGWAARSGVAAAQLVRAGFTGPPTVLEGRFGYFEAFLHGSELDLGQITRGLGSEWSIPGIFFKPYPANHFTHAAIDAGIALRGRGLDPAQIERVELGVPQAVVRTIGEPIEVKREPVTGYQAQFSGPYAFVAGLLGGEGLGVGMADFTDALAQDPHRRALMASVSVVADETCTALFPHEFPAIARVVTRSGEVWEEAVLSTRGGPKRPLTMAELATKFRDNAAAHLAPESIAALEELITTMEDDGDVEKTMAHLAFEFAG